MIRYRAEDQNGDYQFGRAGTFLVDSAPAVAQAVRTRLTLWEGEWFLDLSAGTPYLQDVIGHGTQGTRDMAIKQRVLDTPGVSSIDAYASAVDAARAMKVSMRVMTHFGAVAITVGG